MKPLLLILIFLFFIPDLSMAQKKKKYNEGDAPKVSIYEVSNGAVKPLSSLQKDHPNRIRVVLEGGVENIKHTMFVTSKQAVITKDTATKDEYMVIPQKEICEIIVDVKTFEIYYAIKETENDGKRTKEIIKEYPPKTYMVGYERYEVK